MSKDKRNKASPWVVRWSDGIDMDTGRPKWFQKSFRYKFKAQKFAAEKRTEAQDISEAVAAEPEMTLGRFLREWGKTRNNSDFAPGTRTLDENTVGRLLCHFSNNRPLNDITPMQAAQFIAGLSRLDGREKPLSSWSRARTLRNVKTMFNTAVEWGLIVKNPFAGITRPKLPEGRWHYLMPDEFHALLNARSNGRDVPLRCKVVYALAYCCGLRLGEILSLTWDENIKIMRSTHEGAQTFAGEVHIVNRPASEDMPPFSVKDKEARRIQIPRRCLELLMDLRGYNEITDQTPYVALDQGQYQTLKAKWARRRIAGQPWRNQDMQNNTLTKFKRHVRWAGIQPHGALSLHVLRKCCITGWANSISNPEVVRKLAGHADIKTTMKYYSQVTEEQRRKAAEAIDRLLEAGLATGKRYV
jgi:integrase